MPIACGGVVVNPGDIVIADEDGIAVVPPFAAEAVLARAIEARHKTDKIQDALARGEVTNIANITKQLVDAGAVVT